MDKGYGLRRSSYMLIFVIMAITIGCQHIDKYKGYEISDDIRVSIWKMETDFCTSIMKKENLTAFELMSDSMAAYYDKNKLDSAFYPIGRNLIDYPFAPQSIYYQKATFDHPPLSVRFDDEEIKPFQIGFDSNTRESAVTTAILGDGENQGCVTMFFGKHSDKWEIENLRIGFFLVEGKDANDWLTEAEKWIEQKDYAMAAYCSRMCNWLLKPADDFWRYDNEGVMLDKMEKVNRKVNRNLKPPHQLHEIHTKPEIRDFHAIISNDKVYPGFVYNTQLSLSDSQAIEWECSKLDVVFASYFKNMDHDSIFVKVVHHDDLWTQPTQFLMFKRKLDKGLLVN